MTTSPVVSPPRDAGSIDPRGPRFTAAVTAVLLVAALLAQRWISVGILSAQALFFAIGVGRGVQFTPTGVIFRRFLRPTLAPPVDFEDARPPRFAQGVGLGFAVVAVIGYAVDAPIVGAIATAFALAAALLNAVFGFCLGCELYLLIRRVSPKTESTGTTPASTSTSTEPHNNQKKEAIA